MMVGLWNCGSWLATSEIFARLASRACRIEAEGNEAGWKNMWYVGRQNLPLRPTIFFSFLVSLCAPIAWVVASMCVGAYRGLHAMENNFWGYMSWLPTCHVGEATCHVSGTTCGFTCHARRTTCHVRGTTCHVSGTTCHVGLHVSGTTCHVRGTTCHVRGTTCHVRGTTCHVRGTTCKRDYMPCKRDYMPCKGDYMPCKGTTCHVGNDIPP